ncbi:uncharacterized protein LOC121663463 [Corvus kubaryi]|uniref:uncharacterized protein LOC121663463 n=1 Tax=Corvus kubaryi TaxID=68294 RepID=UPI001C04EFCC|nr:uncharacterized protein LOC121663463 [Corvus kubaryi]XP_041881678.1 uncharacterized protein LOC121663463 [Corvus kubaryi]
MEPNHSPSIKPPLVQMGCPSSPKTLFQALPRCWSGASGCSSHHRTIGRDCPFPCSGSPPAGDACLAWPGLSHLGQVMDEGVPLVWELGGVSLESCSGAESCTRSFFWQTRLMPPLLCSPSWSLQGLRDRSMGTDHLLLGPASPKGCGSFLICSLLPWLLPCPWFLSCHWGWIPTLPGAAPFLPGSPPGPAGERDQEVPVEPWEGAWDWWGILAETPHPGRSWKPPRGWVGTGRPRTPWRTPNEPEALKLPLRRSSQDVSWDICSSQGKLGVQRLCVQILGALSCACPSSCSSQSGQCPPALSPSCCDANLAVSSSWC